MPHPVHFCHPHDYARLSSSEHDNTPPYSLVMWPGTTTKINLELLCAAKKKERKNEGRKERKKERKEGRNK